MTNPLLKHVPKRIRELTEYAPPMHARRIKLDANEAPFSLPGLHAELLEHLGKVCLNRYPDPGATAVRSALATRYGGMPSEYVVGSGSDEIIALLIATLSRRSGDSPASVLFPTPSFVMYDITARARGLSPTAVPLTADFQLDPTAMQAGLERHRPTLCFLATPNNPTGNLFDPDLMDQLADAYPSTLFVIDNAYLSYALETEQQIQRSLAAGRTNVAMMGTLSKVGLAAIRFGYVRLPPELASEVNKVRQPYNLNSLTLAAAELAIRDAGGELKDAVAKTVSDRDKLAQSLAQLSGVQVFPSAANFLLVHVGTPHSPQLSEALLHAGISVKNFGPQHRLATYLRITVGSQTENQQLLDAVEGFFG